jgi:ATP-dependent Clp protease ATP-binding subunit ClpC
LDNFGRDLTALAREGKLDPVIGVKKKLKSFSDSIKKKEKQSTFIGAWSW